MNIRIAFAQEMDPLAQWHEVQSVITARENQAPLKMKLSKKQAKLLITYFNTLKPNEIIEIQVLQKTLPKTATELLHAIATRDLDKTEAQKMAAFLQKVPAQYHLKNVAVFDENTSHIIGREWHEIDYSGEGMTWQAQKAKYQPYGITSFKTLSNLQKFFPVESRLPYFYKVYGKNL
ncbi:MAG: hypothetical protein AB7V32_00730 [Candidatus Berkiella sp.]